MGKEYCIFGAAFSRQTESFSAFQPSFTFSENQQKPPGKALNHFTLPIVSA